ncbi:MAG TPA: M20/M25/M40 family metallo-hydrolase [Pyrinomonadaceae bacterium]|nr:M20/M25/M40 family metallo-hydrolase [Pyrinomonadaceae bacterium]
MKKRLWRISTFPILSLAIALAAVAQQPLQPSADRLRTHITYLASDALEGRHAGTPGADRAATYIAKEFSRLKLQPGMKKANSTKVKGDDYLQHFPYTPRRPRTANVHGEAAPSTEQPMTATLTTSNVIGVLEGSDPTLKNEAIVIGAHYDHLGRDTRFSLSQREGGIHYGADDNASGVAGILELARFLTSQKTKPRRSIVFIAFGGEEEGLLGSNYYVNHPVVPIANTVAMINLDMVGRLKNKNLIIGGVGTAPEWKSMIESANLWQGLTVTAAGNSNQSGMPVVVGANGQTVVSNDPSKSFHLTLNQDGFGPSDHSSFYGKQVPVLFFWTGTHEDYHKPSDTADKINYDGEVMILGMVAKIVREIDANDKRPTYAVTKAEGAGRATGFRVYLGTIPNYADSGNGLLLDGVRDESPAAKAGLKAGDRIVKLAGRDVRDVYDYTAALGEMTAGQEYEVEIVRGTERLKLKLTPAARR